MEVKPATTFDEQVELLKKRNCCISDPVFCRSVLQQVNYYRLSAYFLPFRGQDGNYRDGTSFYRVFRIYEFDRKMRQVLFGAIEQIELYLRTQIAYYHAHKYGPLGYMDDGTFGKKHDHEKFLSKFQEEIRHNNKILFVKHHLQNYDGKFPLWVATELFSLGMMSYFYSDMVTQDKKALAREMYATTAYNLDSWLRCCTDLRNICAHHGRLYFRKFSAIPATPEEFPFQLDRRLFDQIMVLRFLYPDSKNWNHEICPAVIALIHEYDHDIVMEHIGFPENWETLLYR